MAQLQTVPTEWLAGRYEGYRNTSASPPPRAQHRCQQAHALDPTAFAEREIARVQGFMDWYRYTMAGGAVVVIVGLAVFLLRGEPLAKAIGLAAVVLGATALHIDFFSKALSTRYLADVTTVVGSEGPSARTREAAPRNGAGS